MDDAILEVRGAVKRFGGALALNGASLRLRSGEIHALLGENGAGKSTLLKALAGVHRLDDGEINLHGKPLEQGSTRRAREQGVSVIYQEPSLFPDLTLAENVFVGRQPRKGGHVDWPAMQARSAELFDLLGVHLSPNRRAAGLSIADQQIIEIAKALSIDAQVIIMDEPTAALSAVEAERLMGVVRRLRDRGAAVVFVSHRLDEVFVLCDRYTVMRDGVTVAEAPIAGSTPGQVVQLMVGRELTEFFPKAAATVGQTVLEVEHLSSRGMFEDISFCVRAGEIVGLAGLVGSGRSEVVRAVFGIDRYDSGRVLLHGHPLPQGNPRAALRGGVALVPEDRRQQGLFMPASVSRNVAVTVLDKIRRFGLVRSRDERAVAQEWSERLQLRHQGLDQAVERLSGGNQQKVVLGKWLATNPRLLVIDEPTRGIDVGTKAEVHRLLGELAAQGLGILMISSELPEVLAMADRVFVLREGRLMGEFSRAEATQERIMLAATGQVSAA